MDYEKLINCLERKTADTHELQAASAIIGLRQRVQELEKECDKELARNRPLRNLIASLEEQKSHWNKQRDEYREAVATLDSERAANAKLTAERDALKQQRDELLAALEELSLYVAYNGDDWVQKKAKAAIASVKEK